MSREEHHHHHQPLSPLIAQEIVQYLHQCYKDFGMLTKNLQQLQQFDDEMDESSG